MRCPATVKVPNGGAPRFFGQVPMVVMLSGPGYDFRQGIQRGVIQG